MKKLLALTLTALLATGLISGCGNGGSSSTADGNPSQSPASSPSAEPAPADQGASGEKVSLEYWIAGDPRRTPCYEESVADFMAENPDIEVKVVEEIGDNTQIQQKLMTMISSGSAPGVIHVDTMYVGDMAKAGTIVPLNDFDGAQELSDQIFPGVQEPLVIDGQIYGYPIRANSIQLIYNKKMFREAGLDPEQPPKTFDQVAEYAQKLTKTDDAGNVLVYGYESGMTKDAHWTAHVYTPILWSYGGGYQNEDGSSGLASEASLKTLAYWQRLMVELKVSPTERIDKGFQTEKVAMIHSGEWEILGYKSDYPDLEFGFATLPVAAEGVAPQIPLGGRACVIPNGVKETDAAWKLIQWVMNDEEQMRYTSAMVGLTAKQSLLEDPWFDDNPEFKHCLNDMQYVRAKAADNILQMNTLLSDAVQDVILNGADPQQSLDTASEKYNGVLGK